MLVFISDANITDLRPGVHATCAPALQDFSRDWQIRGLGTKVPQRLSGVQGWSPGGGLGALPQEADDRLWK